MQDPIRRLEADMTVDGAALSLAAAVCSREAERHVHEGRIAEAAVFVDAARLLFERHDSIRPMMVQPGSGQ
jgi:hypothetical protein